MSTFETSRVTSPQHFARPRCADCGALMLLARIDSDKPGQDLRIFECGPCDRFESVVVKFRDRV